MHCIAFCTSTEMRHFSVLALQYDFPIPFGFYHKMLVFPLSLREPAHKLGACLNPLIVPHHNHPEKLSHLRDLMTMTHFLFYEEEVHTRITQGSKLLCLKRCT